jgi:hypothetical protein
MQCACAMLSSVTWPVVQYFCTLCHKRGDFRKKKVNSKCVLIFSTNLSRAFLIIREIARCDEKCTQVESTFYCSTTMHTIIKSQKY